MKCSSIQTMISVVLKNSMVDRIYPIDYSIGMWWSSLDRDDPLLITFKYNLFHHLGKLSSVGNDIDHSYQPSCYDGNYHTYNFFHEKFQTFQCERYLISPCGNRKLQRDLVYVSGDSLKVRSVLRYKEKHLMMKKLKISIHTSATSCDDVCKSLKRTCDVHLFPLINSCEEMVKSIGCPEKRPCIPLVYRSYAYAAPLTIETGRCMVVDYPEYQCHAVPYPNMKRLCVCRE
jgi:hypothetical protein